MKFLNILIVIITINFTTRTVAQEREVLPAQDATGSSASDLQKDTEKFNQLIATMWTKEIPLIDDTNFDSFIEPEDYKDVDVETLKLEQVYPNFYKEGYNYRAIRSYRLTISERFKTVVVTVLKGDHEMETSLINYDSKGDIIDSKVVAYDEIAEGMFRAESKITQHDIVVNQIVWEEEPKIKQFTYQMLDDGSINEIDSRVLNNELSDLPIIKIGLDALKLSMLNVKTELVVTKEHPDNPDDSIVVIPEIVEEEEGYFELNNHILIINGRSGEVMQKYSDYGLTSDAIEITGITIDTARYQVSENNRAFGIRVSYYSRSQPNPYSNKTLSLFVKSGDSLRNILNSYDAMEYFGEWDTKCNGEFTDVKNTFIMSKEKTNGYFDIIVKSEITDTESFLDKKGECNSTEKLSTKKSLLKYNGKAYN